MNQRKTERIIQAPASAAALFRAAMPKEQKEERVFVLPLDAHGRVLAKPVLVSVGHEDGTAVIDAGAIFREALKVGAEEIIVAHNHPSGNLTPSRADIGCPHLSGSRPSFLKYSWKVRYTSLKSAPVATSLHTDSTTARYAPW